MRLLYRVCVSPSVVTRRMEALIAQLASTFLYDNTHCSVLSHRVGAEVELYPHHSLNGTTEAMLLSLLNVSRECLKGKLALLNTRGGINAASLPSSISQVGISRLKGRGS